MDAFDVDAYAAKYSGRNRIDRLMFIGQKCPQLRGDAQQALLRELKNGLNTNLYLEVLKEVTADNSTPESITVDLTFVENVKRNAAQQHERLEQELNSYKSTMIKESIRMGHNDLGEFYYQLGDLPSALKSFAQARDYCTTDKHIVEMCLNVCKVGLHMRNYAHVTNYLTKLEQISSTQSDAILKSKISSSFGLVALHDKNYHRAALKFIDCNVEIGATYNEVLHAEDIALYGGICALASFQREELKEKVINNSAFKAFLELVPWLRELISDFYSSNYASCLQTLETMQPELQLDIYLHDHVDALCKEIRSRGIIQYFYPYLSVDLHEMARTFNTKTSSLEKEICELITADRIHARMDSYQKKELAVHNSASRAILVHLCQRLTRLESLLQHLQADVVRLRSDASKESEGVRGAVTEVQTNVDTMVTQLKGYGNAMELFQSELETQKTSLSWLSNALTDHHARVTTVDEKVDTQAEITNSKIMELSLKMDELPLAIAALQGTARAAPAFSFRKNEDRVLVQTHMSRRDSGGGPYTNLEPFTIPDDMKAKVEMRIRKREQAKAEADAAALAELTEAYRRLQLASNPRLGELRIMMDQCQEELRHAFELIRSSNLQLYSCCESKVEKKELMSVYSELKQMHNRLRNMEVASHHRGKQHTMFPMTQITAVTKSNNQNNGTTHQLQDSHSLSITTTDKSISSFRKGATITAAQIPELRVSLLELSRNLNMLKHQWKKKHPSGPKPVVMTHMEKVVAMVNDAYSVTAEEPVDLIAVSKHVEKVGRVLGSDFSVQILSLMGERTEEDLRLCLSNSNEMATALCRYSDAFTDMFFRNEKENKVATAAMTEWSNENRKLEKMSQEMDALVQNQHKLEEALAAVIKRTDLGKTMLGSDEPALPERTLGDVPMYEQVATNELKAVSNDLRGLKEQVANMRKHFVTEDAFADILQQLELWKSDREKNAVVIGHRYVTGAPTAGSTIGTTNYSSTAAPLLRRSHSGTVELDPLMPLTSLDTNDRPKSQPKLDPLQIHKISGEVRPSRSGSGHAVSSNAAGAGISGRTGAMSSKILARSQMMRSKTGKQND